MANISNIIKQSIQETRHRARKMMSYDFKVIDGELRDEIHSQLNRQEAIECFDRILYELTIKPIIRKDILVDGIMPMGGHEKEDKRIDGILYKYLSVIANSSKYKCISIDKVTLELYGDLQYKELVRINLKYICDIGLITTKVSKNHNDLPGTVKYALTKEGIESLEQYKKNDVIDKFMFMLSDNGLIATKSYVR